MSDFFYKVGNIICNVPWKRPTKSKLLELMIYFNDNFEKARLFKISLHGAFHSSDCDNTWDIDLGIHFVDLNDKNYQDIYDCFYFLYYHALNKFNILVDIKFTDKFYPTTYTLYNLIKGDKAFDTWNTYSFVGERVHFTDTHIKKYKDEYFKHIKNNYQKIVKLDTNSQLYIVKDEHEFSFDKFTLAVKSGRIYYEDVIINEACNILFTSTTTATGIFD